LSALGTQLTKIIIEPLWILSLNIHMWNAPQELKGRNGGHNSNGYGPQALKAIAVESKSIYPLVTRRLSLSYSVTGRDRQTLSLQAKGTSARNIVTAFDAMYDVDILTRPI
jgi:hypothetical protein